MTGCWVCEMTAAGGAPGGIIHETPGWVVDHCVGPLGIGTLIVRPKRHVLHVADLDAEEAAELGAVLRQTAGAPTRPGGRTVAVHLTRSPGHRAPGNRCELFGSSL